jgi:hypothetical protein
METKGPEAYSGKECGGGGDFLRRERGTFTRYTFKNEVKNIYVNTDNI